MPRLALHLYGGTIALLSDPLAVLGVFMMGASAGALLTRIKCKGLFPDRRKALEASPSDIFRQRRDPMTSCRKKPYSPPEVRNPTREQAALILLGRAWDGDQNAKELLEYGADALFPPSEGKAVSSCADFVTAKRERKQRSPESCDATVGDNLSIGLLNLGE